MVWTRVNVQLNDNENTQRWKILNRNNGFLWRDANIRLLTKCFFFFSERANDFFFVGPWNFSENKFWALDHISSTEDTSIVHTKNHNYYDNYIAQKN